MVVAGITAATVAGISPGRLFAPLRRVPKGVYRTQYSYEINSRAEHIRIVIGAFINAETSRVEVRYCSRKSSGIWAMYSQYEESEIYRMRLLS